MHSTSSAIDASPASTSSIVPSGPSPLDVETQGEKIEHRFHVGAIEAERPHGTDAFEQKDGTAPLEAAALALRLLPDEAVDHQGELPAPGVVGGARHLEDCVLHMGGDDTKVFLVECQQFQSIHAIHPVRFHAPHFSG